MVSVPKGMWKPQGGRWVPCGKGVRGQHPLEFRPGDARKLNHLGQCLGSIVPFPSTFQTQRGLFANCLLASNVGR